MATSGEGLVNVNWYDIFYNNYTIDYGYSIFDLESVKIMDIKDKIAAIFTIILAIFIGAWFCAPFAYDAGGHQVRQEAVDTGNATWTVDSKGNVQFNWKEYCE